MYEIDFCKRMQVLARCAGLTIEVLAGELVKEFEEKRSDSKDTATKKVKRCLNQPDNYPDSCTREIIAGFFEDKVTGFDSKWLDKKFPFKEIEAIKPTVQDMFPEETDNQFPYLFLKDYAAYKEIGVRQRFLHFRAIRLH